LWINLLILYITFNLELQSLITIAEKIKFLSLYGDIVILLFSQSSLKVFFCAINKIICRHFCFLLSLTIYFRVGIVFMDYFELCIFLSLIKPVILIFVVKKSIMRRIEVTKLINLFMIYRHLNWLNIWIVVINHFVEGLNQNIGHQSLG